MSHAGAIPLEDEDASAKEEEVKPKKQSKMMTYISYLPCGDTVSICVVAKRSLC